VLALGFVEEHVKANQEHDHTTGSAERVDGDTEELQQERAAPGHNEKRDCDGPGARPRDTPYLVSWSVRRHAGKYADVADRVHHGEESCHEAGQCGFRDHVRKSLTSKGLPQEPGVTMTQAEESHIGVLVRVFIAFQSVPHSRKTGGRPFWSARLLTLRL
jgi:hypothetical protein